MGLAEKRWVQERKKTDEEAFVAQLKTVTQVEVPVEIDWDAFSANMGDAQYISHDSYGLPNLVKAFKEITFDELGKEAVKGSLKKIVITPAPSDQARFAFESGVVQWHAYFGSSSSGYVYADQMKKTIEAAL
ncbi:MAG: hypothetical protein Q8L14_01155 [Myxococcales bacterium]|nr:hypothetical protein [Myxococcales bacterium]